MVVIDVKKYELEKVLFSFYTRNMNLISVFS